MLVTYEINNYQIIFRFENGGLVTILTIHNMYSKESWEKFYTAVINWNTNPSEYVMVFNNITMGYENHQVYFYTSNTYISISLLNADVHFKTVLRKLIDDPRMDGLWVEEVEDMDF